MVHQTLRADQKTYRRAKILPCESTIVWERKESSNYNEKLDKNPIFNAFLVEVEVSGKNEALSCEMLQKSGL